MGIKDTIKAKAGEYAKKGVKAAGNGAKGVALSTIMAGGKGIKAGWELGKNRAQTKKYADLKVGDFIEEGQVIGNMRSMSDRKMQEISVTGERTYTMTKKGSDRVKVITAVQCGQLAVDFE